MVQLYTVRNWWNNVLGFFFQRYNPFTIFRRWPLCVCPGYRNLYLLSFARISVSDSPKCCCLIVSLNLQFINTGRSEVMVKFRLFLAYYNISIFTFHFFGNFYCLQSCFRVHYPLLQEATDMVCLYNEQTVILDCCYNSALSWLCLKIDATFNRSFWWQKSARGTKILRLLLPR